MAPGTMIISSSASQTAAQDGLFGKIFAEGIGGNADNNRDTLITASELFTFLVNRMSPSGQIPVASGDFNSEMVLAQGVSPISTPASTGASTSEPTIVKVYPNYKVPKAKFVFDGGANHLVQCREQDKAEHCSDSCYVWEFKAGPCTLKAMYDGQEFQGEVVILQPGKYACTRMGAEMTCSGPS